MENKNRDITTIQIFKSDGAKIKELAQLVGKNFGSFVSQRMAIMLAVNKLLESERRKK